MTRGYLQIEEDTWIAPTRKYVHQCCDCGLVHHYTYAVVGRKDGRAIKDAEIQFKVRIDRRKTAASRRKYRLSKDSD